MKKLFFNFFFSSHFLAIFFHCQQSRLSAQPSSAILIKADSLFVAGNKDEAKAKFAFLLSSSSPVQLADSTIAHCYYSYLRCLNRGDQKEIDSLSSILMDVIENGKSITYEQKVDLYSKAVYYGTKSKWPKNLLEKALINCGEMLELEEISATAKAYFHYAHYYFLNKHSNTNSANKELIKSLDLIEKYNVSKSALTYNVFLKMGYYHARKNNNNLALNFLNRALAIYEKGESGISSFSASMTAYEGSIIAWNIYDMDNARSLLQKAENILRTQSSPNANMLYLILSARAKACAAANDRVNALKIDSIITYQINNNINSISHVFSQIANNRSHMYDILGDSEESLTISREAYDIVRALYPGEAKRQNAEMKAHAAGLLGEKLFNDKQYHEAIKYLNESISVKSTLSAKLFLASCHLRLGKSTKASQLLMGVDSLLLARPIKDAYDISLNIYYINALSEMVSLSKDEVELERLKNFLENRNLNLETKAIIQSLSVDDLINDLVIYAENLLNISSQLNILSNDEIYSLFEHYRSFELERTNQENQYWRDQAVNPKHIDIRQALKQEVYRLKKIIQDDLLHENSDSLFSRLDKARYRLDSFERFVLNGIYEVTSYQDEEHDLQFLQNVLKTDEMVLMYLIGRKTLHAVGIYTDTLVKHRYSLKDVDRLLISHRDHATSMDNIFDEKVAQQLYSLLVEPLIIPSKSINKMYVVPDGELNQLAFETLRDQNNDYLVSSYSISYQHSGYLLAKRHSEYSDTSSKLLCGVSLTQTRPTSTKHIIPHLVIRNRNGYLQGAQRECEIICRSWPGHHEMTSQLNTDKLQNILEKYDIIHLAMHAEVDHQNIYNSALLSGTDPDDRILISDILAIDHQSDLITLGACQTGIGNFEPGLLNKSLASAFLFSGSKSVLMSLWNVPDESTSEIMTTFYNYLAEGYSKDVSLQKSKLNYINSVEDPSLAHPYYWAGFVLIGDTACLQPPSSHSWLMFLVGIMFILALAFLIRKLRQR